MIAKTNVVFMLFLILFPAVPFSAMADTFRCPSHELVSTGDNISVVLMKCGEPYHKERRSAGGTPAMGPEVEEWTYNEGGGDFMYILTFNNGKLIRIQNVGSGF